MQAELDALAAALESPERPVMAIVGGAKVSTKLDLLTFMLGKVDILVIGGAMANTLLFAQGTEIGASLVERDMAETARGILARARAAKKELVLPVDAVVAARLEANAAKQIVAIERVPKDRMILDIGPKSVALIAERLARCRTLVWNGPVGAFETKPFDAGTIAIAQRAAELTRAGALTSVAGGGDTVAALAAAGVIDTLTYVSTAGGAFLEWLEGASSPAWRRSRRRRGVNHADAAIAIAGAQVLVLSGDFRERRRCVSLLGRTSSWRRSRANARPRCRRTVRRASS